MNIVANIKPIIYYMSDIVGNTGTPDYTGEKVTLTAFRGPAVSPETGLAPSPRATTKTSACCGNSQEPNPPVIPTPELGPSAQGALWEFLPSYRQSQSACLSVARCRRVF